MSRENDSVIFKLLKSADVINDDTQEISQQFDGESYPKLPEANMLEWGEIALNIAKDYEVIAIKNNEGEIVYIPFNVAIRLLTLEGDVADLAQYTEESVETLSAATVSIYNNLEEFKVEISNRLVQEITSLSGSVFTTIDSLSATTDSKIAAERERAISAETALNTALSNLSNHLDDIIPSDTDISNKLTNKGYVDSEIKKITDVIPNDTSSGNPLTNEAFVNSSISTNTATFRGTFNLVSDLHLTVTATTYEIAAALVTVIPTSDKNDYSFVQIPTSDAEVTEIQRVDRYKYNGTNWTFEYSLNNSGFTSKQWAAINSGIVAGLVVKLEDLPNKAELDTLFGAKQDKLTFDNTPRYGSNNPVTSGGIKGAVDERLPLSGGTVTGNLILNIGYGTNASLKANSDRNFLRFNDSYNGYIIGDGNVKLALETGNVDLKHRYTTSSGATDYVIVDTRNIQENLTLNLKTLNGTPIVGTGDIDIKDIYLAMYGVTPYSSIMEAYWRGKVILVMGFDGIVYFLSKVTVSEALFTHFDQTTMTVSSFTVNTSNVYSDISSQQLQENLVSGENIKTINNQSVLGSGDIALQVPIDPSNQLDADYVDDTSSLHKFVSTEEKAKWDAKLPLSGGTMTGDIDLNGYALLVRNTNGERPGIQFRGSGADEGVREGIYVGNPHMRLFLEADPNLDLIHKKGEGYYDILDTNNVATKGNIYQTTWGDTLDNIINAANAGKIVILKRDITYNEQKYSPTYVLNCFIKRVSDDYITEAHFYATLEDNVVAEIACKRGPTWVDNGVMQLQENLVSGTNIKTINNESILGAGNVNFAKYEDTLINTESPVFNEIEVLDARTTVYTNAIRYTLKPNQKIVLSDTVGANKLYLIDATDENDKSILISKTSSVSWNNFTNSDIIVQLASESDSNQSLTVNTYWRGADNVFVAEYGVTTYQQVLDAYNAGKYLILKYNTGNPDNYEFLPLKEVIFYSDGALVGTYSFVFSAVIVNSSILCVVDITGYAQLNTKLQRELTFDNTPTLGSTNPVTSDGIKTALDTKQDTLESSTNIKTINNQTVLGSGNLDVKDIFIVEYNVTPFADILNAYNAGKTLFANYAGMKFIHTFENDSKLFVFSATNLGINGESIIYSFSVKLNNGSTEYTQVRTQELQKKLISGTNIKTINGNSILGSGNLDVHPEIVILTDTTQHNSGHYEDLMRKVDVLKLDTPQIFIYTAYSNGLATTAMCFSTCTNTESPTLNAVVKQTLFLGTNKFTRTLSNTVEEGNKYKVVDGWAQILDVKESDLNAKVSKSGDSMTGDLNLNYNALLVSKSGDNLRNGIKFENNATGILVGNGNMNTTIQSGVADLKHRKGSTDYNILDTSNVKTVNGNSIYGSGDIDTKESFEVTYNVTPYADILAAYNAGKKIYCNYGGVLFFMTIAKPSSFYFQSGFHDYNLEMSSFYVTSTTGYSAINYQYLSQAIADLDTIRSGAAKGATAYQKPSGGIPESDLTSELQQTIDNVPSILQSISAISDLVPEQASSSNQLADKTFVNSSIQTNTAEFKGTRNLVTDLSLTTSATQQQIAAALASAISSADNNDYCFVQIPTDDATPTQIARVDRYKYNGSAWLFEWSLNNSSFTTAQWASINSGIVDSDVTKLNALPTKTALDALFAAKQDTLVSGTNIKTINSNSILGSGDIEVQPKIDSTHKLDADLVDDTNSTHKFVTSAQTETWDTVTEKAPLPFVVSVDINPSDVISVNKTLAELETAQNAGRIIRVQFYSASGISFEEDATRINESLVITYVAHAVSGGKHHIVTIYEEDNVTKASYQEVLDSDKQDVIQDLETIRSGAAAGATAYQKPQSGIPASDIASDVIPDISNLANKSGSLSQDFAAKSLGVLGRGTSNGIKLYRADGQIPYGRIIMESDLVSGGIDYMLPTTGVSERSAVVLATTASVDAKYTKPSSGIPASDIAAGVIPDVSGKQDTLVSGTNIKSINNESILGAGNVNFAKYEDTLISSDAITCDTAATIGGVSLYVSDADYYLQPNQKIVFADTVGNNTLYIINYDDITNPFIISSGKDSISWNNFTNNDVRIQLASSSNTGQTLTASRYWRGTDNVFIAEYGVTTYQQVLDAYNAGKIIVVSKNDGEYWYKLDNYVSTVFRFSRHSFASTSILFCALTQSNMWAESSKTTEDTSNKATDFTTLNNTKYPTTKAVADYAQPKIDSTHKLDADLVDDTNSTHKFVTSAQTETWNTVTEKAPLPFVVSVGKDPSDVISVNKTLAEIETAYNAGKKIRVQFFSASGVSFEEDATRINESLVITYVTHAVSDGKHYIITIYEENNVTKASYVETYDNPEIVNLTNGEHSSGYYEDLMRTVDVLKLNTSQIFLYTAYNNNHIATTAMCFSTCTNTESPTTNAVIKQTLFLGTYKSIRTLSNITSDNKYQVVDSWTQILDVKQSDLDGKVSRSGSSMTGDLNMDYHELQVCDNRNGIKFENNQTGVLVGNGNMNTTIQSGDADLKHRKGRTDYTILDTSNVKTINDNSILGSGNLTLEDSSNKTNDIANNDTDTTKYPSCKGVADYVSAIVGNINSILDTI